ncbi:hypothetical protein, partial [Geoglobus sp.]
GLYVFHSLCIHGGGLRLAIVYYSIVRVFDWISFKLTGKRVGVDRKHYVSYGNASAYAIGMIHGVGAETPSQMYMFALTLTAGMRSSKIAAVIILAFAAGLVMTNTLMGIRGAYGYVTAGKRVYRYLAIFTAVFSIALGLFFMFGSGLPDPVTP